MVEGGVMLDYDDLFQQLRKDAEAIVEAKPESESGTRAARILQWMNENEITGGNEE